MNGDGYYCVGTILIHFLDIVRPAVNLIGRKNSVIVRNNFVKSRSTSLESEQNADKAEQENLKKIENLRQFQQIFISPFSQFLKKKHHWEFLKIYRTILLNDVLRFGFASTITKAPPTPGYLAVRPDCSRFRFVLI